MEGLLQVFGRFNYEEMGGGKIKIIGDWEQQNMTLEKQLPVVGKIYCHKRLIPTVKEVLTEIEGEGLEDEIRTFECL